MKSDVLPRQLDWVHLFGFLDSAPGVQYPLSMSSYEEELKEREVRQKKWETIVSNAVSLVEDAHLKQYPGFHHTAFFGAMGIDPKLLAIWCFFSKDEDLQKAQKAKFTDIVQNAVRDALKQCGYPEKIACLLTVSFSTDEDVQRTCGGNYYLYLK